MIEKISGPVVDADIEVWYCCRPWPIITRTTTYNPEKGTWKREAWWTRTCKLCEETPKPQEENNGDGGIEDGMC